MDTDLFMLSRQAGIIPLGFQNINRSIHRWVNILLNVVAPRMTLKGKFWMPKKAKKRAKEKKGRKILCMLKRNLQKPKRGIFRVKANF